MPTAVVSRHQLLLAPEGRGGWRAWTDALGELLAGLAEGPTTIVAVTQAHLAGSLLLTVGDGEVHVEVPAAVLDRRAERSLASVGYRAPATASAPWVLEEPLSEPLRTAELVAHTLVAVLGADGRRPIAVELLAG